MMRLLNVKSLMLAAALPLFAIGLTAAPAQAMPAAPASSTVATPDAVLQVKTMRRTKRLRARRATRKRMRTNNARKPARAINRAAPAYQRGSGQQTGGPARELIPRR